MGEIIFALLMFLNGKLENYSPKANLAECLEQKRKVERDGTSNTLRMECKQIEAIVEVDKHGVKLLKKLRIKQIVASTYHRLFRQLIFSYYLILE